jgi:5,10-methenyltetrahydromethanopterin hydrogenase|tara:strand:- start:196 stop:654 length:459 start_codon:yes stop_codon:yes gene_type:complete
MANKLDIFKVLEKVDDFDIDYFNGLTDDEKKSLAPYVLMLWMSGTKSQTQLVQLNVFMNSLVFKIPPEHSGLLYKLACVASDGKRKKYNWVGKKTKSKKYATATDVLSRYYRCSTAEALGYIGILNYDDVAEIAMELGEQDDTLKKIKKEMK